MTPPAPTLIMTLVLLCCVYTSCGEYDMLEHQRRCERTADSLFRAHKDSLYKKAEQYCLSRYDEYYDRISDSLRREKKKEIQKLLQK